MKLNAETGENKLDVEIIRDGCTVTATVDRREYIFDASEPEKGVFLLKHDNAVYEAMVSTGADGTFDVQLKGRGHQIRIFDPKRLRGSAVLDGSSHGLIEIRSAMPGKVVRIILAAGSEVNKNDCVLVVEAMKMQNELKSPQNGTVKEILVTEGDTVATGSVLATIE